MNLLLAISLSLFHYINLPVIDMRANPCQKSEVVSQALFSEEVSILEEREEWVKIETSIDQYKGWIQKNAIYQRQDPFLESSNTVAKVNRCAAHLYNEPNIIFGPKFTLPFESSVKVLEPLDESNSRWIKVELPDETEGFIQRGDVEINPRLLDRNEMCSLSLRFLSLPYTWGGRSSFGYDCSGFVQMLYRQMGIYLPRDSKDQVLWHGFRTKTVEELRDGDLIFFGFSESAIRHVGLYLGNDLFIHATQAENAPFIRISSLSDPNWNGSGQYPYLTFRGLP